MRLKSTRHREPGPALRLGIARARQEEIRIAAEVVDLRECDRIEPILERCSVAAGNPAIRCASEQTNSPSVAVPGDYVPGGLAKLRAAR